MSDYSEPQRVLFLPQLFTQMGLMNNFLTNLCANEFCTSLVKQIWAEGFLSGEKVKKPIYSEPQNCGLL